MLFTNIGILDENLTYVADQWVGVRDGRIAYVGSVAPDDAAQYGETYDGTNKLLMPALYNAHAHAPMTLLRGYAENLPLQAWLSEKCWPFEAKMTQDDNYWATLLACAEMARFGVVSFSDMYDHIEPRVQAVTEAGMKANLCQCTMLFEEKPYSEYPAGAHYRDYIKEYHKSAQGRILMDYTVHAEYTSNPLTCTDIAQAAKEDGLRVHLHLSETKSEHEECKQRHNGMTPAAYFESIGMFDVPVIAAHCVWCEPSDWEIMHEHGAYAVCNPASNMKLGSGFAPVQKMIDQGVQVCLGTDGVASNNNHDMFQDMYLMATIYKGYELDPCVVKAHDVLKAATCMGALAQGREQCGVIAPGFAADLCVLDVSGPAWCPMTDPVMNIVYAGSGSDVVLTMCDGEVLYRDGVWPKTDLERVRAEVATRSKRILSEL